MMSQDMINSTALFQRVAEILETARTNVVRAVNSNMVVAYWLIGREIVLELQQGEERAEYGKQVVATLSQQLTEHYGKGYSAPTLWNFRQFYQVYANRYEILSPMGRESAESSKLFLLGRECIEEQHTSTIQYVTSQGFSPQLSWSHYRALMRVAKEDVRNFYEQEAIECCWSKAQLERQIHSQYYERLLKSQHPQRMKEAVEHELSERSSVVETLKNPYVLEFLGLPDVTTLHESQLEAAIITHLQHFMLELGKGFAFVARQKRMRYEESNLYVDLVFYNCILKCYLLIDLKMGELSYQDVGQMDGYVRMFDDTYTVEDDNPTIGLILCTEKNEAIAKYSVLNDRKQIFASKYMLYLPTEEELQLEIGRERKAIEAALVDRCSNKCTD